jgi:hypothetical protein
MPTQEEFRAATIRVIVPNLRFRRGAQLAHLTDDQLAEAYESFSMSEDFGDNDAKFLERI